MGIISPMATNLDGTVRNTGSMQSLGRNDFLKLMITKLQYQDPLNPMDDADFVAQLAQFASLEQMSKIADGIEKSYELDFLQMQSINNTMSASLIGKEVKATFRAVYADENTQPKITYSLDDTAANLAFVITDDKGEVVRTLSFDNVEAGTHSIIWDGKDDFGNTVEAGYYTIEANATNFIGEEISTSLELIGIVESINYRDGAAYLIINGTEIPMGGITAIGQPGSLTNGQSGSGSNTNITDNNNNSQDSNISIGDNTYLQNNYYDQGPPSGKNENQAG